MEARLFGPPGPDQWIRIRGTTVGAMVCFGFGAYSLYCWVVATGADKRTWLALFAMVAFAGSVCSILQLRAMRRAPTPALNRRLIVFYNACFFAIVATEVVAIILGGPILSRLHRSDLYPNWVDGVVGIHFLPIGKLFKVPLYYATGLAITLAAAGSLLLPQGPLRVGICSAGTGVALWMTGGLILYSNLSILPAKRSQPEICQP